MDFASISATFTGQLASNSSRPTGQTADDGGTVDESFRREAEEPFVEMLQKSHTSWRIQGLQFAFRLAKCAVHERKTLQVPLMHKSLDPDPPRLEIRKRKQCAHLLRSVHLLVPSWPGRHGVPGSVAVELLLPRPRRLNLRVLRPRDRADHAAGTEHPAASLRATTASSRWKGNLM